MLDRVIRLIELSSGTAAVVAAAVMVLLIVAEVAARYLLSSSIFFANELARMMFVWTIFFSLPLALARGRHVGILLVDRVLRGVAWRTAFTIGTLSTVVLLSVVVFKSVEVMLFNWDQTLQTLPVSAGLFYLPIPLGAAFTVVYLLIMTVRGERVLVRDDEVPGK